jgi:hypothetical protein
MKRTRGVSFAWGPRNSRIERSSAPHFWPVRQKYRSMSFWFTLVLYLKSWLQHNGRQFLACCCYGATLTLVLWAGCLRKNPAISALRPPFCYDDAAS